MIKQLKKAKKQTAAKSPAQTPSQKQQRAKSPKTKKAAKVSEQQSNAGIEFVASPTEELGSVISYYYPT